MVCSHRTGSCRLTADLSGAYLWLPFPRRRPDIQPAANRLGILPACRPRDMGRAYHRLRRHLAFLCMDLLCMGVEHPVCPQLTAATRTLLQRKMSATIQMLLDAGATIDAKDMHGDSPLTWASWHLRPDSILRKLCYGEFHIRPNRRSMAAYLLGEPHV